MARYSGAWLWFGIVVVFSIIPSSSSRSFVIDYDNNVFLKDGEPFQFISGSFDYFRVPRFYWRDRLRKMKAGGLNTLTTYVAWNRHEAKPGVYNFTGENDVVAFVEMAQEEGLLAIVRPGPFICAEWDLGGFPAWMLKNYTTVKLRSSKDPNYIATVDRFMSVLLPKMRPLLYANGGPIIAMQVENEYGMYITCDHVYMTHLTGTFRKYLGNDVVLTTVDPPYDRYLECGTLPELLATLDFGPGIDPVGAFNTLRKHQPKGPLVDVEFYTGGIDHWGVKHVTRTIEEVTSYLDKLLAMNASVNFDMFEGGTDFGFWNGANAGADTHSFSPQQTTYDYDSPLTEAGDYRPKYYAIMDVIAKYAPIPKVTPPPAPDKYAYGKVLMHKIGSFYDVLPQIAPSGAISSNTTLTMEQVDQNFGFMLYRVKIPSSVPGPTANISIPGLADRGIVFVNKVRQATLIRVGGKTTATIKVTAGATLDILVENMGRINHGPLLQDPKGIVGNVILNKVALSNWMIYPMEFDDISSLDDVKEPLHNDVNEESTQIPTFYTGEIPPSPGGVPRDTFVGFPYWFKGQVYINGFNLGRYWPVVGPQVRLYVPANLLNSGSQPSKVVLFELDNAPCQNPELCYVEFLDYPDINGPTHPLY